MNNIISLFQSKSFWGIVVMIGGYVSNLHFKFADNWNPDLVALLLAIWGAFMVWARQMAAKSGDLISIPKTFGMGPKQP